MEQPITDKAVDDLLLPFISAQDESISNQLLSQLLREHAEPVIRKIIKHKLHVPLDERGSRQNQDALELAGDLRAVIILELRDLKQNPRHKSIVNFPNFVAMKTYSACADYFREKNPQRWRLKNLLRRHLKADPKFALWQAEDHRWYAGLTGWREATPGNNGPETLSQVATLTADKLDGHEPKPSATQPSEFLAALFQQSGQPIGFDRVVAIAAETWEIKDRPFESVGDFQDTNSELSSAEPRIDLVIEQRLYLEQLWAEVCQLPVLQRAALLLNLRDAKDGGVIAFLPFLGISSKTDIAKLLQLPYEQFETLWSELPLDDTHIAELFGITRQQVINLRKTARERLARRMRKLEETPGARNQNAKK